MKKKASIPILLVFLCAASLTVRGGPPYVTDDPEPVEYQHWEFYVATEDALVQRDWSGTAPHIEINYGAAPNLQLHVIAPMAWDLPPEGRGHYGYGDTELGFKYRFIQETNGWPQVGIFPLFQAPTGSASDNLGTGNWQAFVPIWLQKSWGPWTAYGGGGYGINSFSGHGNWGFVGGLLQYQVVTNASIGVEVFHQTAAQVDFPFEGTLFNVGTVIDFTDHQHLLFSAGRSISGPNDFQVYLAYQLTFGPELFHSISRWFGKE